MDRQEYLVNRFKGDFLQYCLLQKDSHPASQIAEAIYATVEFDAISEACDKELERLIEQHLSLDKLYVDGKISNALLENMEYDVKREIAAQYRSFLDSVPVAQTIQSVVVKIERAVELEAWSNGIVNMQGAIELLVKRIAQTLKGWNDIPKTSISERELIEKYVEAKDVTLMEKIQGNNIDDIVQYRNALILYLRAECENLRYQRLENLYIALSEHEIFARLKSNFATLAQYAQSLGSSTVDCPQCDEWECEYNKYVPTAFFQRNVARITAEKAFQMTLLYLLAQHEQWLTKHGMLVNGELKIYTHPDPSALDTILNKLIG